MTVENDGLPPTEGAHAPDDTGRSDALDPPTEQLPLDGVTATKVAAEDAAARRAEAGMPATPPPAAAGEHVVGSHGSMEGDLFDEEPSR
jgi:hypothetical protein